MDLTVSIVTWNSGDTIQACLRSILRAIDGLTAEVIVLDNGSSDSTTAKVRSAFPTVKLIQNQRNEYFAAHNRVFKLARGKYTAIMNPDVEIGSDVVRRILDYLDSHADIVSLTPAHRLPDGSLEPVAKARIEPRHCLWIYTFFQLIAPGRRQRLAAEITAPSMSGCQHPIEATVTQDSCIFVRTDALQAINGYHPTLKLYHTEDDLCLRLAKYGKIVYWPAVEVQHAQSTSVRKVPSFKMRRIRYLDMLTYLRLYFGLTTYLVFLPLTYLSIAVWGLAKGVGIGRGKHGIRE